MAMIKKATIKKVKLGKKEKVNESKKSEKESKTKKEKFISFIVLVGIIAAVIIAVIILAIKYSPSKKVIEKFTYQDFNYLVEDFGETKEKKRIIFYHTEFNFSKYNTIYRLYLKNDPRNNTANLDLNIKEIKGLTYVAIDKNFEGKNCSELILASYKIGEFLASLQVKGEVAVFYENYSQPTYQSHFVIPDYDFASNNNVTVIVLKYGNSTSVFNKGDTIIIESNGCTILLPTEKFILFLIDKLYKNNVIKPLKFEEFSSKFE